MGSIVRIGIDARPLGVRRGGIWRYTEELIHALARVDDRNHYLLYAREPCRDATPLGDQVAWHAGRVHAKPWVELAQLLGRVGDVELFHGTNYTAPLVGRFPTVLTVHDLTVHLFPDSHPPLRRLRHRLLPVLCRRAARVIADSFSTKRDLVRHYRLSPDKVDVVHLAAGRVAKIETVK